MFLDPALVELWHHGASRCLMTITTADLPFLVVVFDGQTERYRRTFQDHNEAVAAAVEELHRVTASTDR